MARKLKIRRGLKKDLPVLDIGELGFSLDTAELYIGSEIGNVLFSKKSELDEIQKDINEISQSELLNRVAISANNTLLIDGIEQSTGGNEDSSGDLLIADEPFSGFTTTTKIFTKLMNAFCIENLGTNSLTFKIGNDSYLVKSGERFEANFTPFNQVAVSATSEYIAYGKKGNVKSGYAKEPFSGETSISKTFSESMNGLVLINDGNSIIKTTINDMTFSIPIGGYFEEKLPTFNSLAIATTVPYRAYGINGIASHIDETSPVLTISGGGFFTGTKTIIMSAAETVDIFYTLDGSTPTTSSNKYTKPLSINETTTLKAFAKDATGNVSATQIITYTLESTPPADNTAPVLTIVPVGGNYTNTQTITMSVNETADIFYTLDGTEPTTSSSKYTGAITISSTKTLKAFAKDTAGNVSPVGSQTYTITTTAPIQPTGTAEYFMSTEASKTQSQNVGWRGNSFTMKTLGQLQAIGFKGGAPEAWEIWESSGNVLNSKVAEGDFSGLATLNEYAVKAISPISLPINGRYTVFILMNKYTYAPKGNEATTNAHIKDIGYQWGEERIVGKLPSNLDYLYDIALYF